MESYFHKFSAAITECKPVRRSIWPPIGAAVCLASAVIMTGGIAAILILNEMHITGLLFFAITIMAAAGMLAACLRIVLRW